MIKNNKTNLTLNIFFLALILIVFFYILFYSYKYSLSQRTPTSDPIGTEKISLEIFTEANYRNLGDLIRVGIETINTTTIFSKFYNVSPLVTILDKSFYKLTIPATTNINLTFERIYPEPLMSTKIENQNCYQLAGRVEGRNCVIVGMINSPSYLGRDKYELWKISAMAGGFNQINLGQIYFYVVSSTRSLNRPNHSDQSYYLIPISTSVTLTNTYPINSITYNIYSHKHYCPIIALLETEANINPSPSSGDFTTQNLSFNPMQVFNNANIIFISRNLEVNRVPSGIYTLKLVKKNDHNTVLSNLVTINVNNNITPPTLSLLCQANPTSGLRIGSSTTYILTASTTNQNLENTIFTLVISTSGGEYLRISSSSIFNSPIGEFSTSVIWTASGTYYATATVRALATSTQASCQSVNVEACQCLYRLEGVGFGAQIRCQRSDGSWENWRPYSGHIPQNCNCENPDVRRIYGDLCRG
ncbi:MAG: hypothetical protein NZ866_00065 [Patescibacteria group bacterium]|nr:hypothetical protein [Patescibacteria group bacterium]